MPWRTAKRSEERVANLGVPAKVLTPAASEYGSDEKADSWQGSTVDVNVLKALRAPNTPTTDRAVRSGRKNCHATPATHRLVTADRPAADEGDERLGDPEQRRCRPSKVDGVVGFCRQNMQAVKMTPKAKKKRRRAGESRTDGHRHRHCKLFMRLLGPALTNQTGPTSNCKACT
jgi:hypothetical protein